MSYRSVSGGAREGERERERLDCEEGSLLRGVAICCAEMSREFIMVHAAAAVVVVLCNCKCVNKILI